MSGIQPYYCYYPVPVVPFFEEQQRCPECPEDRVLSPGTRWCRHPNNRSVVICHSCYQRFRSAKIADEMTAKGARCHECPAGRARKVKK